MTDGPKSKWLHGGFSRALFLIAILIAPGALAADFTGKKIEFYVPFREGGGSDAYARYLAPLFHKYLPGTPDVVVYNVPGGGSVRGVNLFSQKAKGDGLAFATTGTGTYFSQVLGTKAVRYDLKKFIPILSSSFGVIVYVSSKLGITDPKDIAKLRGKELVYGGQAPTKADLPMLLAMDMLKIKMKPVWGLSSGKQRQAFKRGELNILYDNMAAYSDKVVPMIKNGTAVPLFTFGFFKDGKVERDPIVPDLPSFPEIYQIVHGKAPSGIDWETWKTLFNIRVMASKMIVLPEGTPNDIVSVYEQAVNKMVSVDFQSSLGKKVMGDYPQSVSADARQIRDAALVMSNEQKKWIWSYIEGYGVSKKKSK
ncbi:MAG: tricarboxylate transporter [Rhodospirillales bacterium]